jgi:hypothetical protein
VNIVGLVAAAAVLWVLQAVGLSRLMSRRGFHPLPWFAVSLLMGPAMWPLAVVELISGPPRPELLRRGAAAAELSTSSWPWLATNSPKRPRSRSDV